MVKINFELTLCLVLCVATNSNAQLLNIAKVAKIMQFDPIARVQHEIGNRFDQFWRKPNFAKIANDESDCPVISTKLGDISGIRQHTVFGNGTFCSYRGIRYAEPPIGKLRFKV